MKSPNKKMIEIVNKYGSLEISLEYIKDIIEELSFIYYIKGINDDIIAERINFYMDVENIIQENLINNGYKKIKK
jgi:hypothetical protein